MLIGSHRSEPLRLLCHPGLLALEEPADRKEVQQTDGDCATGERQEEEPVGEESIPGKVGLQQSLTPGQHGECDRQEENTEPPSPGMSRINHETKYFTPAVPPNSQRRGGYGTFLPADPEVSVVETPREPADFAAGACRESSMGAQLQPLSLRGCEGSRHHRPRR